MTTVSVTFQNPKVAATVADSVIRKLQEYIINYRTSKAKEDCIYWEKLFKERQQEYYAAQKKYASYIDSHDNVILQSVRTEQERLQNDMGLAYQCIVGGYAVADGAGEGAGGETCVCGGGAGGGTTEAFW